MNDPKTIKASMVVEASLRRASRFLHQPRLFELAKQYVAENRNPDQAEYVQQMLELAILARVEGVRPGFWRSLKKIAEVLGEDALAEEYEATFHQALADSD